MSELAGISTFVIILSASRSVGVRSVSFPARHSNGSTIFLALTANGNSWSWHSITTFMVTGFGFQNKPSVPADSQEYKCWVTKHQNLQQMANHIQRSI